MKKIIALLLIFAFVKAGAQKTAPGNYTYIAQKYEWDAGVFKGLGLPAGAGPAAFISGQVPRAGASYYDSVGVDSGLYVYSGLAWRKMDAVGGITSLAVIGSTPNANGASISGVTLNLQPADSTFGGVVTTGTQRWRGAKTILDKFVVTRWDASVGYYGVTINHPFSSTATVNGLRIGWFGGTNFGYVQAKKADNTFLPLRIEGGAQVSESGGIDITSYSAGLRLISVDSFTIDYGNPPTLDPTMLYGLNQYGGVWKIKLGDNLTLTDDTLKAVLGSGITINTLYNADDSLTSSRIVDMRSRSLQFINANLFRIEDETGTDQGTYDFNKGIDFVTYNTAKSLNIKSDVINGIILKGRNITTGDSVYIQVNDSLRSVFNNFVEVADSGNYYMQVINKNTGAHGKAWWPASGSTLFGKEDATATENRVFDLNGFQAKLHRAGADFFFIESATDNEAALLQAYNPTTSNTASHYSTTTAIDATSIVNASYNGGSSASLITLNANSTDPSSITYSTDMNNFLGGVKLIGQSGLGAGMLAIDNDGLITWTPTLAASAFGKTGEDVTATANRAFDLGTNTFTLSGGNNSGYYFLSTATSGDRGLNYTQNLSNIFGNEADGNNTKALLTTATNNAGTNAAQATLEVSNNDGYSNQIISTVTNSTGQLQIASTHPTQGHRLDVYGDKINVHATTGNMNLNLTTLPNKTSLLSTDSVLFNDNTGKVHKISAGDLGVGGGTTPVSYVIAASDETTDITTGTTKVTFRMPHAMTVTGVRASLSTASSSGLPEINIKENGTTILSTKITIDVSEKTSTTATTPAVISDSALADDAEITIDIDTAGTGAKGLKITINGTR